MFGYAGLLSRRGAVVVAVVGLLGRPAIWSLRNTGGTATTLLATLTGSTTIGTASSGAIDFNEAGFTQSNGSHVSGTPTWVRLTTSADAFVADINIGSGGMTFTGTIATGVDITLGATSITEGNA
jgi:hypothetical protein